MGFLFNFLIRLFIKLPNSPTHFSDITKNIYGFRAMIRKRWLLSFFSGVTHFVSPLVIWVIFTRNKFEHTSQDIPHWVASYIALLWTFLGPLLIVRFEVIVVPRFLSYAKKLIEKHDEFLKLSSILRPTKKGNRLNEKLLQGIWILSSTAAFLGAGPTFSHFGVSGPADSAYWLLLLGTLIIAYYTGIGFKILFRIFRVINYISICHVRTSLFHLDRALGLGFVADIASTASLMFASGWLFIPLLTLLLMSGGPHQIFLIVLVIVPYIITSILSLTIFLYPIKRRIIQEKIEMSKLLILECNQWLINQRVNYSDEYLKRYSHSREILSVIISISNWPQGSFLVFLRTIPLAVITTTGSLVVALLNWIAKT